MANLPAPDYSGLSDEDVVRQMVSGQVDSDTYKQAVMTLQLRNPTAGGRREGVGAGDVGPGSRHLPVVPDDASSGASRLLHDSSPEALSRLPRGPGVARRATIWPCAYTGECWL